MRNWIIGLAASCLMLAAPAVALAGAQQQSIPITNGQLTACNGDTVNLTGTIHAVVNVSTSTNGTRHASVSENFQDVSGTDVTTGTTYEAVGGAQGASSFSVNGTGPATIVENVNLVSQGSTQDLAVTIFEHFTVNANGTTTISVYKTSSTCNG